MVMETEKGTESSTWGEICTQEFEVLGDGDRASLGKPATIRELEEMYHAHIDGE